MTTIGIGEMFVAEGDTYDFSNNTGAVYYSSYKCKVVYLKVIEKPKNKAGDLLEFPPLPR